MNTPKPVDSASVPGPFFAHDGTVDGVLAIRERVGDGRSSHMAIAALTTDRDHLIALLNKGTHFDEMLAALRGIQATRTIWCPETSHKPVDAAIAKATS